MPSNMKKQTVIVTGASSGIGKEIARYFLKKGDNLVINSATASTLEETSHDLGAGPNLTWVAGNISDKATGNLIVKTAIEKFGSADVLINNAGIYENKSFLEVDEQYLDRFLSNNLKEIFFTTQAVIPQMLKQHDGVVINIGSAFAEPTIGVGPSIAPIASKGAIHALTVQLAAEFGKDHIRVNTVEASIMRTPMHGGGDKVAGLHLLNRIGEPEEVAQMVYAIAKNKYITGAIIYVDGGIVASYRENKN